MEDLILLKDIRIRRLRSLWDTDFVHIAPLTILVGKNSCGKSTFLRSFPLLAQSLQTNTSEPILWYDKNSVDFGSFDESISRHMEGGEKGDDINFQFKIITDKKMIVNASPTFYHDDMMIEYPILISKFINKSSLVKENIEIFGYFIEIDCVSKKIKIKIGDEEYIESFYIRENFNNGFFLPILMEPSNEKNRWSPFARSMFDRLVNFVRPELHKKTSSETISRSLMKFYLSSKEEFDEQLVKQMRVAQTYGLKKFYEKILNNEKEKNKFISLMLLSTIDKISEVERIEINSFYDNLTYVAPVRASAERYYRVQGLAIDKIDPLGINVPLYLYDLKTKSKTRYKECTSWTKENFKLKFDIEQKFGHLSLYYVDEETDNKYNLSDVGFGYSQILPILINLWSAERGRMHGNRYRKYRNPFGTRTITIEQPELHLHPAMQANLIKAFFNTILVATQKGFDLRIIIETHSETMINYLGRLLSEQDNTVEVESMINILVFDSETPDKANISTSFFSKDGYLENWPIGFFDPDWDF